MTDPLENHPFPVQLTAREVEDCREHIIEVLRALHNAGSILLMLDEDDQMGPAERHAICHLVATGAQVIASSQGDSAETFLDRIMWQIRAQAQKIDLEE